MEMKRAGRQTLLFPTGPSILSAGSVAGRREGEGPLGGYFDRVETDTYLGQKTWEMAESQLQRRALDQALEKAGMDAAGLDLLFGGDLLNQCIATSYGARGTGIPLCGLYGACSTMAEGLGLAAMAVDGGYAKTAGALTSSHFAAAERQYRLPLEYGGQRTPTAQWTVTGAGAFLLGPHGKPPYIRSFTVGRVVDLKVRDPANMGSAMAPAFVDTLLNHLRDRGRRAEDYDFIVSGDLGAVGLSLARELLSQEGLDPGPRLGDCGLLIYDRDRQDVHAGGSGCGCSAVVLAGYLLKKLRDGALRNLLFCGTGALLSPVSTGQGETIPCICHGVEITMEEDRP